MIKRYKNMAGCLEFGERESLDGVYVKYEDHKKEIDHLKADRLEMATALYDGVFAKDPDIFEAVLKADQIIKGIK